MDRTIIDPLEQMRDFDYVEGNHDILLSMAATMEDALGPGIAVVSGLAATQTTSPSLTINIAAGRIYQFAYADATAVGSIPQDLTVILQQGFAAAQPVTLTTAGLSAGQSRWILIQAIFDPVDAIRANDPTGGSINFYNASNPNEPNVATIDTVRQGICAFDVISGSPATTGSEVPPTPTNGWVPLYLIDLTFGQTTIVTSQIMAAGPSVGTGVPSNYPYAPFLAGLLNSHHSGNPGQAPKVKLASEVQGVLPPANGGAQRITLTSNLSLYISTTGSDSIGSGLSSLSPFATLQHALNVAYGLYDFAGLYSVTINVAAGSGGSYNNNSVISGLPVGGILTAFPVSIVGAGSSSTILSASSGSTLSVELGGNVFVSGITFENSAGNGISANNGGAVAFGSDVAFGACGGAQISSVASGSVGSNGFAYTISGSAAFHVSTTESGTVRTNGSTVTLTGTPAFSGAYASATDNASVQMIGQTFTGGATGNYFAVSVNGSVNTGTSGNPTYLPGSVPGTQASGGQYV